MDKAFDLMASWLDQTCATIVHPGPRHLAVLRGLLLPLGTYSSIMRVDIDGGIICGQTRTKFLTNTVLHEARHAYQNTLAWLQGNDTDVDFLVNNIPIAPNNVMQDTTTIRTVCNPSAGLHGTTLPLSPIWAPIFLTYTSQMFNSRWRWTRWYLPGATKDEETL